MPGRSNPFSASFNWLHLDRARHQRGLDVSDSGERVSLSQLGHRQPDVDRIPLGGRPERPRGDEPDEGDFCEVSYFLEQEKDSDQLSLWRRRDPNPDGEPLSGGNREEIARSVRGLRFEYFDGLDWYDEWGEVKGQAKAENSLIEKPNVSGLPEAVRITLWIDTKPQSSKKVSQENETIEPPMVFQTVARLNLAAIAPRTALNANATNRTDNATSGGAAPARSNGGSPQ